MGRRTSSTIVLLTTLLRACGNVVVEFQIVVEILLGGGLLVIKMGGYQVFAGHCQVTAMVVWVWDRHGLLVIVTRRIAILW